MPVHVHISNLAAQTGASLFLQSHAPPYLPYLPAPPAHVANWTYDKTEGLSLDALAAAREVTHVIAEAADAHAARGWTPVAGVSGFDGWTLNLDAVRAGGKTLVERLQGVTGVLEMRRSEQLVILRRDG